MNGYMIGPHIINGAGPHLDVLRRWQPALITVLDPNRDDMHRLRQGCPDSTIVGRIYVPDSEVSDGIRNNPEAAAQQFHALTLQRMIAEVNFWQIENEICQDWDGLSLLNRYALERMKLADSAGYKCGILAFSVGNPHLPDNDRMAYWRRVYPALEYAEHHGHTVVVHQYGKPTLWDPAADWYIHRLEHQVLPRLPFNRLQFAVCEYGIDGLIHGHSPSGWMDFTDPAGYAEQLITIGEYVERYRGRVIGYSVFTLGHNSPWSTYDIRGAVAQRIGAHAESWRRQQPEEGEEDPLPRFQRHEIVRSNAYSRVRNRPGFAGDTLGILEPGASAVIRQGPEQVDGLRWWRHTAVVRSGARVQGWTAQRAPAGEILLQQITGELLNRLRAPFHGQARITQLMRENPQAYARYQLKGHNGVDFALTEGTPIYAVDAGYALQVADDPEGFGLYVKLVHDWGESLYAHLSRFAVQPGEHVAADQLLGHSGDTGNSTGPHLHFGVRVRPYDLHDGWRGYSDPLPWLPQDCYQLPDAIDGGEEEDEDEKPVDIERRLAPAFEAMNLQIKAIEPAADSEVVYVIQDVFTTLNGNWEVGEQSGPYAIVQWARDAYLKPYGAPDYFDDAGGDRHLFAAVIGLDGQLVRNHPIRYWSDGFDKLQDPNYQNYVYVNTKDRSGWANNAMYGGSNFSPERNESGPWCWMPEGAAEVICGGGLPNNHHVSTFVVWAAAPRSQLSRRMAPPTRAAAHAPATAYRTGTAVESEPPLEKIRRLAWQHVGMTGDVESRFAAYARQHGLGAPVSAPCNLGEFRLQGFALGIVYMPRERVAEINHTRW